MTGSVALAPPHRPVSGQRRPGLGWAALLALAVLLVLAAGFAVDRWRGRAEPAIDPAALRPWFGPATFADAVAAADQAVAGNRATLALAPSQWLPGEALAMSLMARWRLTGDYADLAEAQRLLDAGVAETTGPSGPLIAAASLGVLVHRLDPADAALTRFAGAVAPETREMAEAAALAGDIALQRGRLDLARRKFALANRILPAPGGDLRMAMMLAYEGDAGLAAQEVDRLLAVPRQQPAALASLMLRRANLDLQRGDWAGAGRWVGAAQRTFPGWWLADAYAAQQFALAGRTDEARRAYTIVAQKSGRPEAMDALAHLLRLQGEAAQSRAWSARAASRWAAIGAQFPEAVMHHRAEHELAVGRATRALAFARIDAAQRPQAPNLVMLARALLAAGQPREALVELDRADAQGWVSATQHLTRSEALAALGRSAESDAARDAALRLNPRAADPAARLVWFGHD